MTIPQKTSGFIIQNIKLAMTFLPTFSAYDEIKE